MTSQTTGGFMKHLALVLLLVSPLAIAGPTTKTTATTTTTTTTTTATTGTETPLTVCKNIVDSAIKKDFDGVQKWSLTGGPKHKEMKNEKGFEKMHKDNMSTLEKITCATEVVAEDRAFVEANTDTGKRLIPFVKTEAGWKFDTKTYMSFYDFGGKHGKHGKKGKM
jgi:hypothetical protein